MDIEQLWQSVLGGLEVEISKANFATWLKYTSILSLNGSELIISVPNNFTKEWLENKYNKLIFKAVRNIKPDVTKIQYIVGSKTTNDIRIAATGNQDKVIVIKNNTSNQSNESIRVAQSNLNKKYDFENFIVGPNNELARQACFSVAKYPGKDYNPLFIYGGVGLGKTHLMQATGNQILKNSADKRIYYLTAEKFLNEVIDAIGNRRTEEFRNKYRSVDVLIIDDIQFIAGKSTTEEELFNTFNALYDNNKQIIISSDRLPNEILTLEQRLRSRFEGGMMVDVQKPSVETRIAIIQRNISARNFFMDENVIVFIAENFDNNIRELQGALNTVVANFTLKGVKPTIDATKNLLKNNLDARNKNILSFKHVLKNVSEFFDIPIQNLMNRCRKKEIVYPRQIAMFLLRKELNNSFPSIGERLGGRDHTTVMHACEKIERGMREDEGIERDIKNIIKKLYQTPL